LCGLAFAFETGEDFMRKTFASLTLAAVAALLAASAAEAGPRYYERPLTVHKRSFLDSGTVPALNSGPHYMQQQTVLNQTPDVAYQRSKFANETLPRRFELPGRYSPLFNF
jgi:hypothetical protein